MYVGGGESEAPIHDIELMPDHYAKDLAFEFLEKFARFECGMKEARCCKRDGKEGRAGLNWEKFKVKLGPRPQSSPDSNFYSLRQCQSLGGSLFLRGFSLTLALRHTSPRLG